MGVVRMSFEVAADPTRQHLDQRLRLFDLLTGLIPCINQVDACNFSRGFDRF